MPPSDPCSQWFIEGAVVLQSYEVLLLYSREVDLIWKRKTTAVTVLYVIVRYGAILQVSVQLALNLWNPSSPSVCLSIDPEIFSNRPQRYSLLQGSRLRQSWQSAIQYFSLHDLKLHGLCHGCVRVRTSYHCQYVFSPCVMQGSYWLNIFVVFSFLRIWALTGFRLYIPVPILFLSLFAPCASIVRPLQFIRVCSEHRSVF